MNCDPAFLIEQAKCYQCIPKAMWSASVISLLCRWANRQPTPPPVECDDPVVIDWLARIAADPTPAPMPSAAQIHAVCDFCIALRLHGIMGKMLVVNPIIWVDAADQFVTMSYPLIYQPGNGNSPFVNNGFGDIDLNANGLLGNGVDLGQYMDTGFNPFNHWGFNVDSGGMSLYETQPQAPLAGGDLSLGVVDDGFAMDMFLGTYDILSGSERSECWNATSILAGALAADTPAFYTSDRTSVILFKMYQANSGIAFNTLNTNNADQTGLNPPNAPMYFMAVYNSGIPSNWTSKRMSFMAIHEGLDASEAEDFFDAVQQLRVDLMGGFI